MFPKIQLPQNVYAATTNCDGTYNISALTGIPWKMHILHTAESRDGACGGLFIAMARSKLPKPSSQLLVVLFL